MNKLVLLLISTIVLCQLNEVISKAIIFKGSSFDEISLEEGCKFKISVSVPLKDDHLNPADSSMKDLNDKIEKLKERMKELHDQRVILRSLLEVKNSDTNPDY